MVVMMIIIMMMIKKRGFVVPLDKFIYYSQPQKKK